MQPTKPKKAKVVSLTVHKNTMEKRQRAERRKVLRQLSDHISNNPDFAGFVLMGVNSDGTSEAFYDCGPIPPDLLPTIVYEKLAEVVNSSREESEDEGSA